MLLYGGGQPLPERAITGFIGDGAVALVRRALSASRADKPGSDKEGSDDFDEASAFFRKHYRAHMLDHTRPYPGVLETLGLLRERHPDLLMAVLTNKPVRPSREICAGLALAPFFFANYGGDSFATKKPSPEGLNFVVEQARSLAHTQRLQSKSLSKIEVVMIGDSPVDVEVAQACGVRSLGCTYGLAPAALAAAGPDVLVDSPLQWPAALGL